MFMLIATTWVLAALLGKYLRGPQQRCFPCLGDSCAAFPA